MDKEATAAAAVASAGDTEAAKTVLTRSCSALLHRISVRLCLLRLLRCRYVEHGEQAVTIRQRNTAVTERSSVGELDRVLVVLPVESGRADGLPDLADFLRIGQLRRDIAEQLFGLRVGIADQHAQFLGREVAQPAGTLDTLAVVDMQHVAAGEIAGHRDHIAPADRPVTAKRGRGGIGQNSNPARLQRRLQRANVMTGVADAQILVMRAWKKFVETYCLRPSFAAARRAQGSSATLTGVTTGELQASISIGGAAGQEGDGSSLFTGDLTSSRILSGEQVKKPDKALVGLVDKFEDFIKKQWVGCSDEPCREKLLGLLESRGRTGR